MGVFLYWIIPGWGIIVNAIGKQPFLLFQGIFNGLHWGNRSAEENTVTYRMIFNDLVGVFSLGLFAEKLVPGQAIAAPPLPRCTIVNLGTLGKPLTFSKPESWVENAAPTVNLLD